MVEKFYFSTIQGVQEKHVNVSPLSCWHFTLKGGSDLFGERSIGRINRHKNKKGEVMI